MVIHAYGLNLHTKWKVYNIKSESPSQSFSWKVNVINHFLCILSENGCRYLQTHTHTVIYFDFFSLIL